MVQKMLGRIIRFFKRVDYREGGYQHPDLPGSVGAPWHLRLRLMLTQRGGPDVNQQAPDLWVRHRRWLTVVFALLLAWLVVVSALAWNFFEG
jgi:hypothetical protein